MITKFDARNSQRSLPPNYDWKGVEAQVRKFYQEKDIRSAVAHRVADRPPVGYVEGPPTLNGQPHMGHVRGRIIKDLYYRRGTLHGDNIVFRGGWDTQGLPVELQAEKELGLTGNKWENLKQVGVERLVEACKELIRKYRKDWDEADSLLGLMLDDEAAYMTYRDAYIEREWQYLRVAWERGLLGEGFKVVPYCPSCQTSLSNAEVALGGYEQLKDPSLYYKVRTGDGTFLALWTTMPFTVVTDEFVGVKPEADYEYVRVGEETWIVGTERKEALAKELGLEFGETVKRVKGRDLEGITYVHPLLHLIPGLNRLADAGQVHCVVAEEFVDVTTGTGLVHMSPANGEDDFAVSQDRDAPVFAPFDDQVRFTEEAGAFSRMFARDADAEVVSALKEAGALVHSGWLVHEYPVCWRSGHRLVWLARREYFYWIDRIRPMLVEAAENVEYFFEAPRNRFLESIRESPAWCVTRERVWGTPLPVWVCERCKAKTALFSRKEIVDAAIELPDGPDFELHKPWVDKVVVRCTECGGRALREPFVLDTWHNSGSAPYSSFTDDEYNELIPARFLSEGIDQTRAWAYTLLVLNVVIQGRPVAPYRSFLFQGHVTDERGRKMSKSLGNVISALEILRNRSVDLTRFYLMWKSSPEDGLSMDVKEMESRPHQVLNTLYHEHVYLLQNGRLDGYDPETHTLQWAEREMLLTDVDLWLLAKLDALESRVGAAYAAAAYNEVCRAIEEMIISFISQSYVRLVRPELWTDNPERAERRLAIYAVLGHTLKRVDRLLHPVAPFVSEYLFQESFGNGHAWEEPLLVTPEPPVAAKKEVSPPELRVELALAVEEACNAAREKAKLKRRWPLREVKVLLPATEGETAREALELTAALCNVKKVSLTASAEGFPASFMLTPNASKVGAAFKQRTGDVLKALEPKEGEEALELFLAGVPLKLRVGGGEVEVPINAFELRVEPVGEFEVAEKGDVFVAVARRRDEELVAEGLARDVARRLQALRKQRGHSPTEVLARASVAGLDREEVGMLGPMKEQLCFLVRVKEVELLVERSADRDWHEEDLDGRPVFLDVGATSKHEPERHRTELEARIARLEEEKASLTKETESLREKLTGAEP